MTLEHLQPEGIFDSRQFVTQVVAAFFDLRSALAGAGAGPEHVAKITSFVVDHDQDELDVLPSEIRDLFGDTRPASTLLGVERLARDELQFEIEAIAVLP